MRNIFPLSRYSEVTKAKKTTVQGREKEPAHSQNGPPGGEKEAKAQKAKSPRQELESLHKELENLREENNRINDLYLRKHAEFENFKKRIEREKTESIKYANESLISELLPVIDSFELALVATEEKKDFNSLDEGVKLILKQLRDVLSKHGLTDIPTLDEPFDPSHHEAIRQVESDSHPSNTVMEVHQKGYRLKGRVLRPARVAVSTNKKN
jgi:molecular chaperone GrpE